MTILPVTAGRDLHRFVTFPWRIYRTDPHWVPPLIEAQMDRLNTARNPFWRNAERALWLVERSAATQSFAWIAPSAVSALMTRYLS